MKVSDVDLVCCFGRPSSYVLRAMICIRKVLAPVWAFLNSNGLFPRPETVQEAQNRGSKSLQCSKQAATAPGPSSQSLKSEEDWLILQTSGLEEVRAVSHERILSLVLEGIGLLRFLNDVWRWQKVDICQAFVLHWDRKTNTTEVFGIRIDAGYRNFLVLTGLETANGQAMQRDGKEGTKKIRAVNYNEDVLFGSKPISYSLLGDPVLQSLFLVLNSTLWFSKNPCPPRDMVYFLIESIKGEKVNWSKSVYEKFIHEIRELQDSHKNRPNEKLQTLAGPLMCFLYSQAKCKAEAAVNAMIPMGKKNDMPCSISPGVAGRWVDLEEKSQYEYDDGEVAMVPPPGCRPETPMRGIRKYEVNVWSKTPPLNQESASTKTNDGGSLQTALEDEMEKIMESEGVDSELLSTAADMKDKLNKTFEEQKRKQERFKLHLRSTWRRPFSAPCSFGCCHRPIYSPPSLHPSSS